VDLDAVTSALMLRLHKLIPAAAESWCHAKCLLEFAASSHRRHGEFLKS